MEVPEDGAGVCGRRDPSPHTAGCSWHYLWSFRLSMCVWFFFFIIFFFKNNTFHFFELDLSCLPTLGRKWEMTFPCTHPWEWGCWLSKAWLLGQMNIEVWFLGLRLPEPPPRPGWGPDSNVALHPQGSCRRCPHPACRLCPCSWRGGSTQLVWLWAWGCSGSALSSCDGIHGVQVCQAGPRLSLATSCSLSCTSALPCCASPSCSTLVFSSCHRSAVGALAEPLCCATHASCVVPAGPQPASSMFVAGWVFAFVHLVLQTICWHCVHLPIKPFVQVVRGSECPNCQGQGWLCRQGSLMGNLKACVLGQWAGLGPVCTLVDF